MENLVLMERSSGTTPRPPSTRRCRAANAPINPTVGSFRTSDGRWIDFTMIQGFRFFADVCRNLEIEELIDDERFATAPSLMANAQVAGN
jgi:crotonobetainyl-CoA:carnitine CoA-transferase CaiB-like acyl-CoA transferase